VVTFGAAAPPRVHAGAIRNALARAACNAGRADDPRARLASRQPLHDALRPWSAHALGARLAGVLDAIAS
jgi:hypothetical protein